MIRTTKLALALLLAAGVAACESDSTGPDEHAEVAGLVVVDAASDAVLASVNAARQVTGSLSVAVGGDRSVEVHLLDEDGDRLPLDDDEELRWEIANTGVAELNGHGDHMHLEGVSAGSTTVVFRVWHGSHSDYDSPAVPITVTP